MRAALIVTGVLGIGTAFTFGAAAVAATLSPTGASVAAGWNGGWSSDGRLVGPGVIVDGVRPQVEPDILVAVPEPATDPVPAPLP
jgi:hypothetical protein